MIDRLVGAGLVGDFVLKAGFNCKTRPYFGCDRQNWL